MHAGVHCVSVIIVVLLWGQVWLASLQLCMASLEMPMQQPSASHLIDCCHPCALPELHVSSVFGLGVWNAVDHAVCHRVAVTPGSDTEVTNAVDWSIARISDAVKAHAPPPK